MCAVLNTSKSGYYKHLQRDAHISQIDSLCIEKVKQYKKVQPYSGTVKMWKMLENEGLKIGRQHLNEVLRENNMLVREKKRFCKTSLSDGSKVYPNRLKDITVERENEVWITEITYIPKDKGFYFLFLLSDMFTRQVIDYEVSSNLLTTNHINMLKRQLKYQCHKDSLIHHSDHGTQYTSNETIGLLKKHGVEISMTGTGKCYDNPIAERINGIFKQEFGLNRTFDTLETLTKVVKSAVTVYNSQRLHQSLGYLTPNDFASKMIKDRNTH